MRMALIHCNRCPAPVSSLYYTCALLLALRVFTLERGHGLARAATQFATVMAVTWTGSQATKLLRAAGALAMAPGVDAGLERLQQMLRLRSRRSVSMHILKEQYRGCESRLQEKGLHPALCHAHLPFPVGCATDRGLLPRHVG